MENIIRSNPTIHKSLEQIFATDDVETFSTYIHDKGDRFSNFIQFDYNGKTRNVSPLVIATKYQATKCIKAFISIRFDYKAFTALHLAFSIQWIQGVEILMEKEVRMISCFDEDGLSPLAYLAQTQNISMLKPTVEMVLQQKKRGILIGNPFKLVDSKNNLGFLEYSSRNKLSRIINSCAILFENNLIEEDDIYQSLLEWDDESNIPHFLKLMKRYFNSKNNIIDKNSVKPFIRSSPFYQFSHNTYYPTEEIVKSLHELLIYVKEIRPKLKPFDKTVTNILYLPKILKDNSLTDKCYIPKYIIDQYFETIKLFLEVPPWFSNEINTKYYGPKISCIDTNLNDFYDLGYMLAHLGFAGCYSVVPHLDPMFYRMLSMIMPLDMDDQEFLSYVCVVKPKLYMKYAQSLIDEYHKEERLTEHGVKEKFQSKILTMYIEALSKMAQGFKESISFGDEPCFKKFVQFITKNQIKLNKKDHGSCQPALQTWFEGCTSSNPAFWHRKVDISYFHDDRVSRDFSEEISYINNRLFTYFSDSSDAFNFFAGVFGITSTFGWRTKMYHLYIVFDDEPISGNNLMHISKSENNLMHVAIKYNRTFENLIEYMYEQPIHIDMADFLATHTQITHFRWVEGESFYSEVYM